MINIRKIDHAKKPKFGWTIDKNSAVYYNSSEFVIGVGLVTNGEDFGIENEEKGDVSVYNFEGVCFNARFATFKDALKFSKYYIKDRYGNGKPTKKELKKFNYIQGSGSYENRSYNEGDL